jgi:hypothetical protein
MQLLSAPAPGSGQDDLAEFYVRFNKIKDHHSRHPDVDVDLRTFMAELRNLVESDGLQRMPVEGGEDEIIDREHASRQTIGQKVDSRAFPSPRQHWTPCSRVKKGWEDSWTFTNLTLDMSTCEVPRGVCTRLPENQSVSSIQLTRAVGAFDAVTG